jgi:hypothetical protein
MVWRFLILDALPTGLEPVDLAYRGFFMGSVQLAASRHILLLVISVIVCELTRRGRDSCRGRIVRVGGADLEVRRFFDALAPSGEEYSRRPEVGS